VTDPASVSHNRAFELLPWLVNGTLAGIEREAVEQHVRACIACRRELKQQQRLHAAVRARRTADVSAEAGFDRLDRELDGLRNGGERRWPLKYATAAPFAVAAAAGLAVLAVLVWFTPLPDLGGNGYETLSTAPTASAAQLDIVFADNATAAQMQQLLDEIDGEIVAGPSTLGRYSVRIAGTQPNAAQLAELLRALAADPRVRFAGRALAEVEP
jgi:hypothetical protein